MLNRSKKNDIIVGIFVLIALGTFMYMTFLVQGTSGRNPLELRVIYPEVAGLEIGGPVLVSGFRSGRVESMKPLEAEDGTQLVVVTASVSRAIPIYKNAKMYLRQQGFIGDKRIEIDPGTRDAGLIDETKPFLGVPYRDITDMFDGSEEIIGNLNATLANLRSFTSDQERIARIDESLANVAKSSDEIAGILAENRQNVKQITTNVEEVTRRSIDIATRTEELMVEARRSVDEMNAMIADLRADRERVMGSVDKILDKSEVATGKAADLMITSEEEIKKLSADLQVAAEELNGILKKVNRGEGTVGKLVSDPRPYEDLQKSLAAIRDALTETPEGQHNREIRYRMPAEMEPPAEGL